MKTNNKTLSVIPVKLGIVKSFIIKGEKTAIVDTGYAGNGNKILCNLQENSIKPEDISLIVITHGHIDHYGSAEELRRLTGAPIAMHRADAEYLKKGINYIGTPTNLFGRIVKSLLTGKDKSISKSFNVDIIFENEVDLRKFGIDGRVIHTPGHTEGSISLILSGGEVIVGDLLMGGLLRKRIPHFPSLANDLRQLKESIKRVIQLSPKIIYPSHGGPFTCAIVEKFSRKTLKI